MSGSRDNTLRVWDIERGVLLKLLSGHQHSVRCIEISGNKVVSGSYDATCKVSSPYLILMVSKLKLYNPRFGTLILANACILYKDINIRFMLLLLMATGLQVGL